MSEFTAVLRDRRKLLHISQRYLSQELGVAQRSIVWWENGQGEPRLKHLCQWARALGMRVNIEEAE